MLTRLPARSSCAASAIPVLRHPRSSITSKGIPTSGGVSARCLPKSRPLRKNSLSLQQSSSASVTSLRPTTKPLPSKEVSDGQGAKGAPPRPSNDLKISAGTNIVLPKQRPSVADLRQSFEKVSQAAEPSGQQARLSFQSKSSHHSLRQSQDMPLFASSKRIPELLVERSPMPPAGRAYQYPPLDGTGEIVDVKPKDKATEKLSPPGSVGDSLSGSPSPCLPKSQRLGLQDARREPTRILHESGTLEPSPLPANEKGTKDWGNSINFNISMDGLGSTLFNRQPREMASAKSPKVQHQQLSGEDASRRSPFGNLRVLKALSPKSRPAHGKVSQLRKMFERASKRFSSPRSLMNLHSRLGSEDLTNDLTGTEPPSPGDESESPLSSHTIARRLSIVPSLTTEISVNDFFCDFVGGPNHEETTIAASPGEAAADVESQMRRESPVKHRIQQFEHLSRDSLNVGATTGFFNKVNNKTGIPFVSKNGKKGGGKRSMGGGWRPIHQKGAAIWRKISSSLAFNRSVDSWKEDGSSEHEPINPTAERCSTSSVSLDRPPPPPPPPLADGARLRFRRSSSFGYSMHRVSHMSRQFTSSQTAPDVHLDAGDLSNNPPSKTTNANNDHSSPHTPRLTSKSFPILTRVSSGLRQPNWFGLDGHFPSKRVRKEDIRSPEATVSDPSTPHSDPNALLEVMRKQSAAERRRRRQEERQLRRDKKLLRALTRWNERREAHVDSRLADNTTNGGKTHVRSRGKGKEKETAEREPQRDEGQSTKAGENETNKKTESGFVIFESKDVKLRHPKPRRPGQVRKVANLYRDKGSSGASVNTKASSGATLKESRQSFRRKASSALGFRSRKGDDLAV